MDEINKLEVEREALAGQLRGLSPDDREARSRVLERLFAVDEKLAALRYERRTPEERERYWVWATNHQMRVQSEAGVDRFDIFNRAWLERARLAEPRIEEILKRVAAELRLDYAFIMALSRAEAGSEAWHEIRSTGPRD